MANDGYKMWRQSLIGWCDKQASLTAATRIMAERLATAGVEVSPMTIRRHYLGDFEDVKMGLARAVTREIAQG